MPYDEFIREQIAGDLLAGGFDRREVRADHRHGLHRQCPAVRLAGERLSAASDDRRHDRQPGPGVPRALAQLCPLPQPQVRSDHDGRLLRDLRHLSQHALSLAGHRAGKDAARPGAAGRRARSSRRRLAERKKHRRDLAAEVKACEEAKKTADKAAKEAQSKLDALRKTGNAADDAAEGSAKQPSASWKKPKNWQPSATRS